MNKLSIIIPVYNIEKYLPRCLDSILAVKSIDWECILIDDGSKDNSWNIICEYTKKYPNKFISKCKENGGVSSTRNIGISMATGNRIMFIDPDDYLFKSADSLLNKAFEKYLDKDIVLFDYAEVYDNKKLSIKPIDAKNLQDYKTSIINLLISGSDMNYVWRIIYKAEIIKNNNIFFNIHMKNSEDAEFNLKYVQFAKSIALINDKPIYAYYQRLNSAVRTTNIKNIDDALIYLDTKFNSIRKLKLKLSKYQIRKLYLNICYKILCCTINGASNTQYKEYIMQIKQYYEKPQVKRIFDNVYYHDLSLQFKLYYFLVKMKLYTLMGIIMKFKVKVIDKFRNKK